MIARRIVASRRDTPRMYAHRGAAAELPENTLPAFRRGVELGADALELDVHMTADGHIVVSHDPTGARMAGVAREIRRCRLEEVREWDVGRGFVDDSGERPFAGRGYHIPTLEEVLEEFPEVILNVDLKQSRPSIVAPVLALLRRMRASERVVVASFSELTLLEVRVRGYRGATGLGRGEVLALLTAPSAVIRRWPFFGNAVQIPTRAGPLSLARPRFIEKCHRLGMRVDFWTVNDADEARRLLAIGADGIMTDDPGAIAPVFAA